MDQAFERDHAEATRYQVRGSVISHAVICFLELKQLYFNNCKMVQAKGTKDFGYFTMDCYKGHFDGKPQAMWPYEMSGY